MAQSLLVQQLLQQLLSGGGQQMLSPLAPVGKLALAAALKNQQKKQESQDAAQVKSLADVLAPAPQMTVAQPGQPAPGLAPAANSPDPTAVQGALQQNNLARAMMGGDPSLGKAMLLEKWKAGMQPANSGYTLGPDQVRYGADNKPIAYGPKKESAKKDEIFNVFGPGQQTPVMAGQTDDGLFFLGDTGKPDPNRPVPSNYQKVGVAISSPDVGGIGPKLRPVEETDLRDSEITTRNLLSGTKRIREQLGDFTKVGFVASIARLGNSLDSQVRQAQQMFGAEKNLPALLSPSNYDFDALFANTPFREEAMKSAALKSNLTRLAYLQAKAMDPGGRLSKDDVQLSMESIAANSGSPDQIMSVLDELDAAAVNNFQNTWYVKRPNDPMPDFGPAFGGKPTTPPEDRPPGFDELTPEEQAELADRLRRKKAQ